MFHLESPIPSISISPAPLKEPSPIEPQRSPYTFTLAPTYIDSPRPQHLLPPPSSHHRSSAKSTIGISNGGGLDMTVFQALLQAAKGTKTPDGLKDSHQVTSQRQTSQRQTKQMERRARFLAKIAETPKACAMNAPLTPPESPVVFHLSPPSPRLHPPRNLPCETSHQESSVEGVTRLKQVDFVTKPRERSFLPSLELISQRVLINNRASPLAHEENRPNHSRNAATQALYDALSKRQATTNKLPRPLPSHDSVGDVIRNRVLELRMKRQIVAGAAELMYQRPNSPGRKRSWAAGLNKKASLSDNYRQPFLPAAPASFATTTTSHHTESPQQRNDFVMHPVRVVISPSVIETTTMDAFVDGMNGGEEDIFASMDALRGSRRRKKSLNHSSVSSSNTSFIHHPLYHPPLPKPPPGVKLGVSLREDSDADEDTTPHSTPGPRRISKRKYKSKQSISSKQSSSISSSAPVVDSIDDAIRHYVSATHSPPKQPVPSINDIIRNYSPSVNQHKPALSVNISSPVTFPTIPSTPPTRPPSQSLTVHRTSLDDTLSRSSMDSVAEEVQRTLMLSPPPSTASQRVRASPGDDRDSFTTTIRRSDNIDRSPSISSFSTEQSTPSPFENHFRTPKSDSSTHALATFLRSPRLTRLLKLRRHPNQRLQVSFSDLGSSSGRPVVVFLGLGCVRYIMGLYDEMAEALGLRLITIDRWGLGKTDNPPRGAPRGVKEWAAVVEEVLEYLNIDRYGILAHSAGAPYAMAFANRAPHKVKGDLCLLAPWVGPAEGGYKWLKYVPTSLIKTAQAAEWKVQAWMLGKPPAINTGIGYSPPPNSSDRPRSSFAVSVKSRESIKEGRASSVFSDYDDLADFQGKYASHSTIHICDVNPSPTTPTGLPTPVESRKRPRSRSGRFFSGLWKSGEPSMSASPSPSIKNSPTRPRLKVLKSMGSLRSNSVSSSTAKTKGTRSQTASLAGTIEDDWSALGLSPIASPTPSLSSVSRGNGRSRRSISLSSPKSPYTAPNKHSTSQSNRANHRLSSPPPQSISSRQAPSASSFEVSPTSNGAALGNALLAASHAEASRGTHADLLQILNYDQKPWGFSYQDFPHSVKVWYGEKDEKIAEGAMRWLEKTMRPGTCELDIVKGAGHSLLYNGNVVVEALETLKGFWTTS